MRHYYETGPIDLWGAMMDRVELCRMLMERGDEWGQELDRIQDAENEAMERFRAMGWEGDIREGPYFFAIPMPSGCCVEYGIVYKQDNNGTCFVSSPVQLPHMEPATPPPAPDGKEAL